MMNEDKQQVSTPLDKIIHICQDKYLGNSSAIPSRSHPQPYPCTNRPGFSSLAVPSVHWARSPHPPFQPSFPYCRMTVFPFFHTLVPFPTPHSGKTRRRSQPLPFHLSGLASAAARSQVGRAETTGTEKPLTQEAAGRWDYIRLAGATWALSSWRDPEEDCQGEEHAGETRGVGRFWVRVFAMAG
ncbi:uncharacterized protein CLUP02_16848 [Colletotrichum lupini]|uniref:Uncharacterized protein n=1 Tax=Colletotrichum lupini TaxID=145971 RepID=A0A9Q8WPX0_9PEZI|nr:uncharacterized protein CLUP02_16848 [Colletotrichum lupini]UQC91314.1 hypothetical protein CLUP02_16848 [Colletotrichum lupini]